ncbi:MAG: hypothetical protein AB8G99_21955 [Planctomycetaceae bacterium]
MNTKTKLFRRQLVAFSLILIVIGSHGFALNQSLAAAKSVAQAESDGSPQSLKDRLTQKLERESEVSPTELAAATEVVGALPITDWLGPLAPMALSPFFGVTCLSGMALWGGDWLPGKSSLLSPDGPLANPTIFWVFLGLTLLTSAPRMTKVSKPFAQAIDHVEAYAGIGTLLLLKILISMDGPDVPAEDVAVYSAGIFSFTGDMLLMLAMVVNMIVVHSVRFFFEFLIWVTPVPFIDACFEVANKTLCAALMALYGYSPTIATAVNLLILVACLFVFRWIHRRVVFCRTMALDPILSRFFPKRSVPQDARLTVFPTGGFGPFPARAKCLIEPRDDGWLISQKRWFRPALTLQLPFDQCDPVMLSGLVANTLQLNAEGTKPCSFSKRYGDLTELAKQLRCTTKENEAGGDLRAELTPA